ncbi:MAG: hypothetical protein Q9180_004797 [Flavoplaca navasiana]
MAVKKEPRLAGKKQPHAAAMKQPHAAAKKQPHAAAKKQPLAAAKKQLLVAAKKKPFVTAMKQPLATAKKEPLVAAKKHLLAAAKKQPLAAAKKSLCVAWKKEPCAAAKKKPCAVVKEEPCAAAKGKLFGRQSHSLGTLETIPEEKVLIVEEVSARAEDKQHRIHCNEKLPDLREFSKHAFLVLEEAMGTVPCVQDIVADSLVYAIERALDHCLRLEFELGDEIERKMVEELGSCKLEAYEEQATILHQFLQEHTTLKDRLDVKGPGIGKHTAFTQATARRVRQANAPEVAGSQHGREERMKEVQLRKDQKEKKKQISEEQIKKPPVRMRVGKERMKEEPVKKKMWRV